MQLHHDVEQIRAAGAEVFVIGNGAPMFIEGFREETGWAGPLYTDPSLAVYRAAELKRGVMSTLDPRGLGNVIRARRRGNTQGKTQGDAWQQGGVLVIGPGGDVRWHHVSDRAGDNASTREILDALG